MSAINSPSPAVGVTAPTLASAPTTPPGAGGAAATPFSQAMSAAATPAAPASAGPGTATASSSHRPRSAPGGSSVPPGGNQPPAAAVAALPAPPALILTTPGSAGPAKPDTTPAAAGIDAAAGVAAGAAAARPGPALPASLARAAVPAARAADADAIATGEASQPATTAAAAGVAPDTVNDAVASAADDAAAALVQDRFPELPGTASAAPGKPAAPPPANVSGNAVASAGDTGLQSATGTTTAARVLPVFSLQAGSGRQGDAAAAAPAAPAADASAGAAAGLAGVNAAAAAQGTAAPGGIAPPALQPASPQFPEQLAAHVSYLVDSNLNGATLQVSPPQLGPIELRVSVDAGHAQVWLSAHSAATVDALQQSSSKLRDMLSSQGFGQVSVDVSQRSFQDRSQGSQPYVWGGSDEPRAQAGPAPLQRSPPRAASGVLDAYA